jgi:hypothetical protein
MRSAPVHKYDGVTEVLLWTMKTQINKQDILQGWGRLCTWPAEFSRFGNTDIRYNPYLQ